MRGPLVAKRAEAATIETYRFWFEGSGWAFFQLDELTGTVAIHSDWGDFTHSWPRHGRKSLKHFLAEGDEDYFARKFHYGIDDVFSPEKSLARIRAEIIDGRKTYRLDREEARELWDQAGDLENESSSDLFLERMPCELGDFLEEPWHYGVFERPHSFTFLVERLLPFFMEWLRANVLCTPSTPPRGEGLESNFPKEIKG
jgi:hypothetical protein